MSPSKGNNLPIPAGMRDWLPPEAGKRRMLMNTLLDKIALSGYQEIATPLLEYYQALTKGEAGTAPDNLYKLLERDGSILALRPEMTMPIARVIGGGKMPGKPPWRLMYGQEVFRYELVQAGRQRGFSQVGVELVGEAGPEADCEILALAISALKKSGLEKFTVSLGHMGVLKGLLSSLSWEQEQLEALRSYILEKDFVGLHQLLDKAGLDTILKEELINLLTRPLTLAELKTLIPAVHDNIRPALQEIARIAELLDTFGFLPYLQIDLSTLRAQDYYTGMVFEIYTAGIGYPIGGGGRYDQLLRHFGRDLPATGFALGVERILLSLQGGSQNEE
ncbi:MAG: ATP phosphoribosyltransferase regulatory subunit [Clostridia bacterium]|jgi:ATP phosphoribosyltransferase regulatory subunit|nr:ATP phosphoribosyltransferase regulatory subunit [Clostridia bacterium]